MQANYLPLVTRELRAAARRKTLHRFRSGAVVCATFASFIWLGWAPTGARTAGFTSLLFNIQTLCAFVFALLAGAFLTSDCLSGEKRGGTLGLLFLAGLKARDVVLGNLLGAAPEAIYVLLALLPVTAVAMFFGGVGLMEFCRVAVALLNALVFSLAAGLSVSAFVKSYARALGGTLAVLGVVGIGLPMLTGFGVATSGAPWLNLLAGFSPTQAFVFARDFMYASNPSAYWISLAASQALAWSGLRLAETAVRNSWMDKIPLRQRPQRENAGVRLRWNKGENLDPVLLFSGKSAALHWLAWLLVLACAAVLWESGSWGHTLLPARVCAFLLKTLVAFQACRFFVETRRTGALEMLLCTPMKNSDLIAAQWRALLRVFLAPLLAFMALCWAIVVLPTPHRFILLPIGSGTSAPGFEAGLSGTFLLSLVLVVDVLALGWFGMWTALTVRKPDLAPALTVLSVLVLPGLIPYFDLVVDMFFISWGATRFQQEFRWTVAGLLPKPETQET